MALLDDMASGQEIYSINEVFLISDVSSIAAYLSRDIMNLALHGLGANWCDDYRQAKAGVILNDFYPSGAMQLDMFSQQLLRVSTDALMAAADQINRLGMGKV
ncbi:hypothetical protein [Pantoea anthophila]|uniref:hypothetical protein n=1 Tax=Pantoea anthophila TaxID=470931 RepID=UPI00301D8C31